MLTRREFLARAAWAALTTGPFGRAVFARASAVAPGRPPYRGPNVLIVRFGGGVRRQETIDPLGTFCPYLLRRLAQRGTLFPAMEISNMEGLNTSHGEGTLNILTGRYDVYRDADGKSNGDRFEAKSPTLFEHLRQAFAVEPHETLIVNGEDRTSEEFYTFSSHPDFGEPYRAEVLSLYRFKTYLLRHRIEEARAKGRDASDLARELGKLEALDYRVKGSPGQSPRLEQFWAAWRGHWGDAGLVNPRGDRLLTELTLWAMRDLRPRLAIVNYNDCDYVHWGYPSHYTRAIAIMDEGIQRLIEAVDADPFYRGNTYVVVVPDCGRDDNRLKAVPYQHHFNSESAHRIFALVVGPRIPAGARIERPVGQIDLAPTIARWMGLSLPYAQGRALKELPA